MRLPRQRDPDEKEERMQNTTQENLMRKVWVREEPRERSEGGEVKCDERRRVGDVWEAKRQRIWQIVSNDDQSSDEIKADDMIPRDSEVISGAGIVGGGGLIQIVVE